MKTGVDFREQHQLSDGTRVVLRHIRPEDAAELKRGFERLSPGSRYRRFFGGVGSLSEATLRYLTHVDGKDHVAIVALAEPPGGAEIGLGVGRFIRIPDEPTAAEVAITVVDDAQGKGLGRLLSVALARAALERGVDRFRGEVLADNAQVRQLLAELGAIVHPAQPGSVVFDIDLHAARGHESGVPFELAVRRLLRAASAYIVGVLHRFGVPPDGPDHG